MFQLANLLGWEKPVTEGVLAIRAAFGAVYEKDGIVRKAEGEAEAMSILTDAQIERAEKLENAQFRIDSRRVWQQRNLEEIAARAERALPSNAIPQRPPEDFRVLFSDVASDVSDAEMQEFFARVLAEEVQRPGTVSRATLLTMKMLDSQIARIFASVLRLQFDEPALGPILSLGELPSIMPLLDYESLNDLQALGLVSIGPDHYYRETLSHVTFRYGGYVETALREQFGTAGRSAHVITLGHVTLTRVGRELAKVARQPTDPTDPLTKDIAVYLFGTVARLNNFNLTREWKSANNETIGR